MDLAMLLASALAATPASVAPLPPLESSAPERIIIPIVQPDCDRTAKPDEVTVCGRKDQRYRIDTTTLRTLRTIDDRNDNANRPRPKAITQSCAGIGPMADCGGAIPASDMALRAIGLAVKAVRGEDLRPALRQGPTDYEVYLRAKAEAAKKE